MNKKCPLKHVNCGDRCAWYMKYEGGPCNDLGSCVLEAIGYEIHKLNEYLSLIIYSNVVKK